MLMAQLLRNQRISTGEKAVPSRPVPKRCTKKSARSTAQLMPAIASAAHICMLEAFGGKLGLRFCRIQIAEKGRPESCTRMYQRERTIADAGVNSLDARYR